MDNTAVTSEVFELDGVAYRATSGHGSSNYSGAERTIFGSWAVRYHIVERLDQGYNSTQAHISRGTGLFSVKDDLRLPLMSSEKLTDAQMKAQGYEYDPDLVF